MHPRKPGRLAPLPRQPIPVESTDPVPPGLSAETEILINGQTIKIHAKDLERVKELGRGQYGRVEETLHRPSGYRFAVKLIATYQENTSRVQIKHDLEVGKNTRCPCVVMCYGGLFYDSEVLVLMELMDMSLDTLRLRVYGAKNSIPEPLLAYTIHRVVTGLEFLRSEHRIMHRDVKPSNMLTDKNGSIKVCDFGISGDLVRSLAPSNVGTNRYLAPERINPTINQSYRIQSDVWSLGLSVIELATGQLCYAGLDSVFQQLDAVVGGEPPSLPESDRFSDQFRYFTKRCLVKDPTHRANYLELLATDFMKSVNVDEGKAALAAFLQPYLS